MLCSLKWLVLSYLIHLEVFFSVVDIIIWHILKLFLWLIQDAKPLPIRTPAEKLQESATLRLQFPVSSGSTHRMKESEWVPVEKTTATATATATAPVTTTTSNTTTADSVLMPPPPIPSPALLPTSAAPTPVRPEDRVFPEVPQGVGRLSVTDCWHCVVLYGLARIINFCLSAKLQSYSKSVFFLESTSYRIFMVYFFFK